LAGSVAAGGFGDPLERDPARVEADVANGDVSERAALEIYGVVLGDPRRPRQARQIRKRRIQGQWAVSRRHRHYHVNGRYGCAKCGTDLGPVRGNYKSSCVRNDLPIEASNPIAGNPKRFIDPLPQFRQFCCPGCGLAIENEIAVAEDPVLRDVEILSK
jgi:N-methylhydantoinase B